MASAFRALQDDFAKAEADQGFGGRGWIPPAGTRTDLVIGYYETGDENTKFKYKGFECPAVRLGLRYRSHEDPLLEEPKSWGGASVMLPSTQVPDEAKWRVERELKRFKGIIATLVGEGYDIEAGWQAVKDMIDASNESGNYIVVKMNNKAERDSKTKKPTGYCTEYLQEILDTITLEPKLGG